MKNLFHHTMDRLGGSGHTKKLHLVELKSENSNICIKKNSFLYNTYVHEIFLLIF
jgi:hypothetical protein